MSQEGGADVFSKQEGAGVLSKEGEGCIVGQLDI